MSTQTIAPAAILTAHEAEQVRRIAAWKSEPPHPLAELVRKTTLPAAHFVERLIPDPIVASAINKAYDVSVLIAGEQDTVRKAGVSDLQELRNKPLEECDRLAIRVGQAAQVISLVEGALTGAGGVLTTLLDIPLLLILSLRTILKVGYCYGYPLDEPDDRRYVIGVLVASMYGSLRSKRERVDLLHELEDLLFEQTEEELIADELVSLLFQLEFFEEIPGIGAVSGALLNLAFMHKVDVTARRVFQERWLRDSGKISAIEPALVHKRQLAAGWGGALARAVHSASYGAGFAVALPVYLVALVVRPLNIFSSRAAGPVVAAAV